MKVSKLRIKNLFGISEMDLNGGNIELSGTNGAGKSSVIDAIRYAMTNRSDRGFIIKDGASEGEIIIETDTGLSINRKKRSAQTDFKSVKQNGNTVNSPEAFLRGIISTLQLSPVEFMQMDQKAQNRILLDMIQYEWNMYTIKGWFGEIPAWVNYDASILTVLHDIQAENGDYFQNRQNINREIREKKAIVSDIDRTLPIGYNGEDWENVSLSEKYAEIEKRRNHNQMVETAQFMLDGREAKVRKADADKEIKLASLDREMSAEETRLQKVMIDLQNQFREAKAQLESLGSAKKQKQDVINANHEAAIAKIDKEIGAYAEYAGAEKKPVDGLLKEAQEVEKMKGFVNEWKRKGRIESEIAGLEEQSAIYTEKIEKARNLPGEILASANIPIADLTVKDGVPLIKGLPVSNLSEGEKLDLCIDVAIQNQSGLQIVLIDGVEKMATAMRERLYAKCKEKGIQFIATRTTDDPDLTVTYLD